MSYESRDREIMMWTENERERETERGEGGGGYIHIIEFNTAGLEV